MWCKEFGLLLYLGFMCGGVMWLFVLEVVVFSGVGVFVGLVLGLGFVVVLVFIVNL